MADSSHGGSSGIATVLSIEAQDVLSGNGAVEFAADHELLSRLRNVNKVRMMSAVSDENQVPPRPGRLGSERL